MSGVRRPRSPRKPRTAGPKGTYRGSLAAGDDLEAAAELVAAEARRLAARWSTQVPANIEVSVDGKTAVISCAVGPAYPNETNAMHPVFARGPDRRKWTWRDKEGRPFRNHRPFLGPAAEAKAGEALKRYAEKVDRLLRKAGFE